MDIKTTPLLEEHKRLGARMAPFGGWLMPIQYSGIIAEHDWTRTSCTLFDICHMGEFLLEGNLAQSKLDHIVTINVKAMARNTCRYGFMLNEQGGVIDDVIVYKISEDSCMIVVNAATTGADEHHLRAHLSSSVNLKNISQNTGKLDLQGPCSRDVLSDIVGEDIRRLRYYTFDYFSLCKERNIISRTGYTGELGYELYISAAKVKELWLRLLEDKRVKPAGLGARDTLRLEVGYPLYGQDIDASHTPLEAGLSGFVDFDKDFIGKGALLRQKKDGVKQHLACFLAEGRRAPRHNYKIYNSAGEIGMVTSGSFSPSLSRGIGMGYVSTGHDKPGQALLLREGQVEVAAVVTDKPFYKKGTARKA